MSTKVRRGPLTDEEVQQCKALLGKPPVLSTEEGSHFQAIYDRILVALDPWDVIQLIKIWHYVCTAWVMNRLIRHGTVAIERLAQQTLAHEAQRAKAQKARKDSLVRATAEELSQTPADVAKLVTLEDKVMGSISAIDTMFEYKVTEMDHNKALRAGIAFQEQIDRLVSSHAKRCADILRELDHYRAGLGELTRRTFNEELEAEDQAVQAYAAEKHAWLARSTEGYKNDNPPNTIKAAE
jgi:hypothetical protein